MAEKSTSNLTASEKVPRSSTRDDYSEGNVIGSGATSIVTAAKFIPTQERVAIKRINLEKCSTSVEELLKEIQAMSQCQHENVVQYYTSFVVRAELWVVMQLCEKGSLLDIVKHMMKYSKCKNGVLDEHAIATVLREVLKGLEYFHSNGQIHRDIKAGNILMGIDGGIRIADFGVSAWLAVGKDQTRDNYRHTFVGTPCWMAPEVMEQDQGYDYKADIWSFGITAIELATGTAPYHKYPPMKVLMLTLQNDPPTIDSGADDEGQYKTYGKTFRKMIGQCLKKSPAERPTARELLKHDFFTKKSKDKKYLLQVVDGVNYLGKPEDQRKNQVRRVPGSSGRLHKTEDGTWEFSDDEMDPESSEAHEAQANRTPRIDEREELAAAVKNLKVPSAGEQKPVDNREPRGQGADANQNTITSNEGGDLPSNNKPAVVSSALPLDGFNNTELHLVLRLRNDQRELHDIKFDYTIGKDTSQSVSRELVEAGLVDGQDLIVMAANLDKIVERFVTGNVKESAIVFRLKSGTRNNEQPCDKTLLGFAQISLTPN